MTSSDNILAFKIIIVVFIYTNYLKQNILNIPFAVELIFCYNVNASGKKILLTLTFWVDLHTQHANMHSWAGIMFTKFWAIWAENYVAVFKAISRYIIYVSKFLNLLKSTSLMLELGDRIKDFNISNQIPSLIWRHCGDDHWYFQKILSHLNFVVNNY